MTSGQPATDGERAEIVEIARRDAGDLAAFREIDRAFHAALAWACGNPMLNEVHAKALASLLYAEVNRAEVAEIIQSSNEAHRAIADAVAKGHTRKAVAAVVGHLDDVERRMVERLL